MTTEKEGHSFLTSFFLQQQLICALLLLLELSCAFKRHTWPIIFRQDSAEQLPSCADFWALPSFFPSSTAAVWPLLQTRILGIRREIQSWWPTPLSCVVQMTSPPATNNDNTSAASKTSVSLSWSYTCDVQGSWAGRASLACQPPLLPKLVSILCQGLYWTAPLSQTCFNLFISLKWGILCWFRVTKR